MDTTVMLVDDEPSTLRLMEQLIQSRCPGWVVVGTAENGQEALCEIRNHPPDLVIADIRMPVMDGLALAHEIKKEWAQIRIIIASGYGDFHIAQSAIRLGVADYMLKPIQPSELVFILSKARTQIVKERKKEMLKLLIAAMDGKLSHVNDHIHPFSQQSFQAALVRTNNFSSRFFTPSNILAPALCGGAEAIYEHAWLLYGRDSFEIFVLCAHGDSPHDIETLAHHAGALLDDEHFTIVVHKQLFLLDELQAATSKLLQHMDDFQALGSSQLIYLQDDPPLSEHTFHVDAQLEHRLCVWMANFQIDEIKKDIERLFAAWENERLPYRIVQQNIRKLITFILNTLLLDHDTNKKESHLLTDALTQSKTMPELQARVLELVTHSIHRAGLSGINPNSEIFFDKVRDYIEKHLAEPITLPALCDSMGISQSYLSKLFRKFTAMTFSEYLTDRRIERSKKMMLERPELSLKIVAELVGYKDALYFSKVFRAREGIPPSRYCGGVKSCNGCTES